MRNHLNGKSVRTLLKASKNTSTTGHVVSNRNDAGAGSLREAATNAVAGDSITFAQGLSGEIVLASDLPELQAITFVNAGGICLSRSGADTLCRGLAVKADTSISGGLPGGISSSSTADEAYVKGISTLGNLTVGVLSSTVRATATGTGTEAVGIETPTVLSTGNILGSITATASSGIAGGIAAYKALNTGNISGAVSAAAVNDEACGLYSEGPISLGELSGSLSVSGAGTAYGVYAVGNPLTMAHLSGAVSVSSTDDTAMALYATDLTLGNLTGSITATGNGSGGLMAEGQVTMGSLAGSITTSGTGTSSSIMSIGNITMTGVAESGRVTSRSDSDIAMGIFSLGDLAMPEGFAGVITATGELGSFALQCAGLLSMDSLSGTLQAQGGGLTTALSAGGGMSVAISGTLSGVDTSGGAEGYALRSGYWDGSEWVETEAVDTVTLLNGARLTGNIDLSGGDDVLILAGADISINGQVSGGTGSNVFIVQGEAVIDFTAVNFMGFVKQGDGCLALRSALDLGPSGQASIAEGELNLGATLTAPTIQVGAAGSVSGTGTIVGSLTNDGVLAPTAIAVSGSLTQSADGTMRLAVSNSASGRLDVTGAASLGGTLELAVDAGFSATGASYEIVTATGGISGAFAAVTIPGGSWQASLTQTATSVSISLSPAAAR